MTRALLLLLALGLVGCGERDQRVHVIKVPVWPEWHGRPLFAIDYKATGWTLTASASGWAIIDTGIVAFSNGDTLRGAEAVRFLFPSTFAADTTGGAR